MPSFPALVLNISLVISLGAVAQWRLADKDMLSRLPPRWRGAAMTVDLAAVIVVLATGGAIAYVVLAASYGGKPLTAGDRDGLVAELEWQAGWLVITAILPRVVALLPDAGRATAVNVYGMFSAAAAAVAVGLATAIPLIGSPPTQSTLAATVLPATVLVAYTGWFFAGWQTPAPSGLESTLAASDLEPIRSSFIWIDERVDVMLWRDGVVRYATQAQLDEVRLQLRRIARERLGRMLHHAPRLVMAAPRFEDPIIRSGPVGWRDRAAVRGLVILARRRPLAPVEHERGLARHPQYKGLWAWPSELVLCEGATAVRAGGE
jgi:hypothetical protein